VAGPPALAGSWAGAYRIDECLGCSSSSRLDIGDTRSYVLNLVDRGGGLVQGTLRLDYIASRSPLIEVSGTVQPDGSVRLTGAYRPVSPEDPAPPLDLPSFHVALHPASGLTGEAEYRVDHAWNYGTRRVTIMSGSRDAPPPDRIDFAGRWEGRILIRSCMGDRECHSWSVGKMPRFDLEISVGGGLVAGHGMISPAQAPIPVAGRVEGDRLIVGADAVLDEFSKSDHPWPPPLIATQHWRIENFTASVDELDRLRGGFTYALERTAVSGSRAGEVTRDTFHVELADMIRVR
jgi:hypothetical protein